MEDHSELAGPEGRASELGRSVPWLWLGLGVIVSLAGLAAAVFWLGNYLTQPPEESAAVPVPTIIRLTAPPEPTSTATVLAPTPTVLPTVTPVPTIDASIIPPELTAGYYASVVNTDGVGVTVRNGPNTSNTPLTVAAEGSILLVLEGPTEGGSYRWWRVRMSDGMEGWVAGDFLAPSAAPQP